MELFEKKLSSKQIFDGVVVKLFVDDIELTNRLLDRAFNSREDRCICKLRRGLRIGFYCY